jgi:hypothetical protein
MSMLDKVRELASSAEEASFYEQVFTLSSWGFTQREIYNTLARQYDCTIKQVEEAHRRIRAAVGDIDLTQLVEQELAGYLAKSLVVEQEMNEIYLRAKTNWQLQNEGQYYDANGKRIEPVSVKDLVKQLQTIEQLRRARLAVLTEMRGRLQAPTAAAPALPEGEVIQLEEFTRKPPDVVEAEFSRLED